MTEQDNPKQVTGRFRFMNKQPVNLDGFATPAAELGLIAFNAPNDPLPSIKIENGLIIILKLRKQLFS